MYIDGRVAILALEEELINCVIVCKAVQVCRGCWPIYVCVH